MKGLSCCEAIMEKHKLYLVAIIIQVCYAGLFLFSKAAITKGMNSFVFVFYRQGFAALALAPFAFICERKVSASLSLNVFWKIVLVSLFGSALSMNITYAALNYTTATFAAAMTNTIPAFTFVMAVCLRMENISLKQKHGMAKVLGVLLCLSGAAVYSFVRGPAVYGAGHQKTSKSSVRHMSKDGWIKGALLTFFGTAIWALWIVLQEPIIKQYPSKLRFTTMQCFFSCIGSAFAAIAAERKKPAYKLGWNINLLSLLYCVIVISAFCFTLQAWVIEKKGPVFVAQFTPLSLVMAAMASAIFFKEIFHWGSVCGAVLLVMGLYSFLWGKSREEKAENAVINLQKSESSEAPALECIRQNI